jgi:hypothetical protein
MNIEQEIQNILDRNFTRGDNAKALKELLVLYMIAGQSEKLPCEHERTRAGHHPDQPHYCLDCREEL